MTSPQNQPEQLSGSNRSEYVTAIKGLKIQELSGFDVVKFSKWYCFDTKSKKKQVWKGVVELSELASDTYWPKGNKVDKKFKKAFHHFGGRFLLKIINGKLAFVLE